MFNFNLFVQRSNLGNCYRTLNCKRGKSITHSINVTKNFTLLFTNHRREVNRVARVIFDNFDEKIMANVFISKSFMTTRLDLIVTTKLYVIR